jgi:hypothetical protein
MVDNKPINSGKLPPLPRGAKIEVDPKNSVITIIQEDSSRRNQVHPKNIEGETTFGRSADVMNLYINAEISNAVSPKNNTIKVDAANGTTHLITALSIGILDVTHKEYIRPNIQTTLRATLILNDIIPDAIDRDRARESTTWFVEPEFVTQNGSKRFSATPVGDLKRQVQEGNQIISWDWIIQAESGFERDESDLRLNVAYTSDKTGLHGPKQVVHKQIVWSEVKPQPALDRIVAKIKDYSTNLAAILVAFAAIIISYYKVRNARTEKVRDRSQGTQPKLDHPSTQVQPKLDDEKAALKKKLRVLMAQLRRTKHRAWGSYGVFRLTKGKRIPKE